MHQDLEPKRDAGASWEGGRVNTEAPRTWKGSPSRPQAVALSGRGRAGATTGCGGQRSGTSPADQAERKWRPRLCTNHVLPAGECHSALRAGSEGAGRAFRSLTRRSPRSCRGRGPPSMPAGHRSVPGGSPPPPRPLRSRGGSGPAREAGPGRLRGPEAPGARPRPGQMTPRRGALPGRAARAPRAPGQVQ